MLKIKRRALQSALEAAKNTFPQEFVGLFREENEVLAELIIAPLSDYEENSSSFSDWFIPANMKTDATFHSHPSPPALPSRQDLRFFSKVGGWHFIACPPFDEKNVNAFDSKGKQIVFQVIR